MRKVKLLALLLSALMVVAVFAGCANTDAIESEVAGLDERVTALEGLLNGIDKELDDTNTKLDEVAGKLEEDKTADEIAKLEQALKDQQAAYDKQLEEQKKANDALTDALDKLTDTIKGMQDKDTAGEQDAAKLADAIKAKAILVAGLKATYDAEKAHYLTADYVEIGKLLETANFEIGAATTTKAVDDLYNGLLKDLEKYDRVDVTVYENYIALKGNITAESADAMKAAKEFLDKTAVPHYAGTTALTAYVDGVKADGKTPNKIDLVTLTNDLYAKQTGSANIQGTLAEVTATAAALDAKIAKLGTIKLSSAATINAYVGEYTAWLARANALSTKNAALVTKAGDLTAAQARLVELTNAQVMYAMLGEYNLNTAKYDSVFAPYKALTVYSLYTNQPTYNAINAKLAAWIAQYNLEAANAEDIINKAEGNGAGEGFYKMYRLDNEKVDTFVVKYGEFVNNIAPRIKALNAIASLSQDAYTEFTAIAKAINDWSKDTKSAIDKNVTIAFNDHNWKKMVNESGLLATEYTQGITAAKAENYVSLYTFANDPALGAATFFKTTYKNASDAAKVINDAIKAIKTENEVNIFKFIDLEGKMNVNGTKYTNKSPAELADLKSTATADVNTIAEFEAVYKTDKYDLTGLLNYTDFNAKKDAVVAKIAGLKVIAADVTAQYEAIMKALVEKKFTPEAAPDESDVNLNYEADVNKAYALYEEWITKGGISTMTEFALVKDSTTEYEFKPIITAKVYEGMHDLKTEINVLRAAATKLVTYFTTLDSVNTYKAFVAKDLADNGACYNKYTSGSGSSAKTLYKVITGFGTYNTEASATTSGLKQNAALQAAEVAYKQFIADNGKQKDAAVEAAKANYDASYRLTAIKSVAYEIIEAIAFDAAAGYGKTEDDFKTYRASILVAINAAVSVDNVRVLIEEFHSSTKHNVGAVVYAGVTEIAAYTKA